MKSTDEQTIERMRIAYLLGRAGAPACTEEIIDVVSTFINNEMITLEEFNDTSFDNQFMLDRLNTWDDMHFGTDLPALCDRTGKQEEFNRRFPNSPLAVYPESHYTDADHAWSNGEHE